MAAKKQNDNNKYKERIFSKDTLCVTFIVFSALILFILFTRSLVFGSVGDAISSFMFGLFGFSVYPLLIFAFACSARKLLGKKALLDVRSGILVFLCALSLGLIVHTATVSSYDLSKFGPYLSACFDAAETSSYSATGLGVIGGLLSYPVIRAMGSTGSYVIFAVLVLFFAYVAFRSVVSLKKYGARESGGEAPNVPNEPPVAPSAPDGGNEIKPNGVRYYPVDVDFDSYRRQDQPKAPPASVKRDAPRYQSADFTNINGREILYGTAPAQREEEADRYDMFSKKEEEQAEIVNVDSLDREEKKRILFAQKPENYIDHNLMYDRYSRFNTRASSYNDDADKTSYKQIRALDEQNKKEYARGSYVYRDPENSYINDYQKAKDGEREPSRPKKIVENENKFDNRGNYNPYALDERKSADGEREEDSTATRHNPERLGRFPEEQDGRSSFAEREEDYESHFSTDNIRYNRLIPHVDSSEPSEKENTDERNASESPARNRRAPRFGRLEGDIDPVERQAMRDAMLKNEPSSENNSYFPSGFDPNQTASSPRGGERRADPAPEARGVDKDNFFDFSASEEASEGAFLPEDEPKEEQLPQKPSERAAAAGFSANNPSASRETEKRNVTGSSARGMGMYGKTDFSVHKDYVRPPLSLFRKYSSATDSNRAEQEEHKRIIVDSLAALIKVDAEITGVTVGPTFTRYDVKVPSHIPSKKVSACAMDIAMALRARDGVNIFPNLENGTNSIEVPNKTRSIVGLQPLLEGNEFKTAQPSSLTFAIGKNVEGRNIYGRIAKMTHLLVAGTTGSGKSCFLNTLILSLIVRYTPRELRLVLVDPKQIEFAVYNHLPHLMVNEIISEPVKVIAILNWAIDEMERRYMLFNQMMVAGTVVRNIDEYNEAIKTEDEKLPKIVIIVDELADLMSVAKKDIEDRISRLAAKSRACGIHLVIATQRPSVDVITGVIKSNLPTRFAFKVAAEVDSRTILDEQGAEKLLGNGDLLYKTSSMFTPVRVQGAFVSSEEVQNVVEYIKDNNEAYYDPAVEEIINRKMNESSGESSDGASGGSVEPVYIDALRMVVQQGSASISMIQRKFSVGYNKAGRIIEWMEGQGYISPFDGAKTRKVLLTPEEFESRFGESPNDGENND